MTKCAIFTVTVFLGLGCSLSAQVTERAGKIRLVLVSLNQTARSAGLASRDDLSRAEFIEARPASNDGFVSLELSSSRRFSWGTSFNWMEVVTAAEYLPDFVAEEPRRIVPARNHRPDAEGKAVVMETDPVYAHGEVGFLYGKSTGKRGGEEKAGYIIGEVGNDKVQFTAGASYQEWRGRSSRLRGY